MELPQINFPKIEHGKLKKQLRKVNYWCVQQL